tara:strand:+ start:4627 stop:9366 length:4740 start_codon:yes stop_codon:yes gene_type:complete
MSQKQIDKFEGLYIQPNSFSEVPEGACEVFHNVTVSDRNVISKIRGSYKYFENVDRNKIIGIFTFNRHLVAIKYKLTGANEVVYFTDVGTQPNLFGSDNVIAQDSPVNLEFGSSGELPQFNEASGNLYFTSDDGLLKLSNIPIAGLAGENSTVMEAGAPPGIDMGGYLDSSRISTFWRDPFSADFGEPVNPEGISVSYKVLFSYIDYNNNTILGAPSGAFTINNPVYQDEEASMASATGVAGTVGTAPPAGAIFIVTVTSTNHGLQTGDTVTTSGAAVFTVPANAEGTFSVTVLTADTFSYDVSTAVPPLATPGPLAGTLDYKALRRVRVNQVAHGLETGDEIKVVQAFDNAGTPALVSQAIGTFTITKVTDDIFTYSTLVDVPLLSILTKISYIVNAQPVLEYGIPEGISTDLNIGWTYRIYRTSQQLSTTGNFADYRLIAEEGLTLNQINAKAAIFYDTVDVEDAGGWLYTNTNTGDPNGILATNDKPPRAECVALFQKYQWLGNITQREYLDFSVIDPSKLWNSGLNLAYEGGSYLEVGKKIDINTALPSPYEVRRYYKFTGTYGYKGNKIQDVSLDNFQPPSGVGDDSNLAGAIDGVFRIGINTLTPPLLGSTVIISNTVAVAPTPMTDPANVDGAWIVSQVGVAHFEFEVLHAPGVIGSTGTSDWRTATGPATLLASNTGLRNIDVPCKVFIFGMPDTIAEDVPEGVYYVNTNATYDQFVLYKSLELWLAGTSIPVSWTNNPTPSTNPIKMEVITNAHDIASATTYTYQVDSFSTAATVTIDTAGADHYLSVGLDVFFVPAPAATWRNIYQIATIDDYSVVPTVDNATCVFPTITIVDPNHTLSDGDRVRFFDASGFPGVSANANGTYQITNVTLNSFDYDVGVTPGAGAGRVSYAYNGFSIENVNTVAGPPVGNIQFREIRSVVYDNQDTSSTSVRIRDWAEGLVKSINRDPLTPCFAKYTSAPQDIPGAIRLLNQGFTDPIILRVPDKWRMNDATPVTLPAATLTGPVLAAGELLEVTHTAHGLVNGNTIVVTLASGFSLGSSPNAEGTWIVANATENTFEITVTTPLTGGPGTFTYQHIGPLDSTDNQVYFPTISTTYDTAIAPVQVFSATSKGKNRLFYSKVSEVEAFPLVNYISIGSSNDPILSIHALTNSLIVIKEKDGIFRVSGDSAVNFNVSLIDATIECIGAQSAVLFSNQVCMLSNQGVCLVNETAVEIISRPIENEIQYAIDNPLLPAYTYGFAFEKERSYYLTTLRPDGKQVNYIYNILTNTWSTSDNTHARAALGPDGRMYYIGQTEVDDSAIDQTILYRERNNGLRTDYSNDVFTAQVISSNPAAVPPLDQTNQVIYTIESSSYIPSHGDLIVVATTAEDRDISQIKTVAIKGPQTYEVTFFHPSNIIDVAGEPAVGYPLDIFIYQAFESVMKFVPFSGGNVGVLKQFSQFQCHTRDITGITAMDISYATDTYGDSEVAKWETTFISDPWGSFPWGCKYWGSMQYNYIGSVQTDMGDYNKKSFGQSYKTDPAPICRVYVSKLAQRSTFIQAILKHKIAGDRLNLQSLNMTYYLDGERVSK